MKVRSKAPLRIGLAGGGTDVSPYSDTYGGCVLSVTINMFAYTTIETRDDGLVCFTASDIDKTFTHHACDNIPIEGDLILHKAIHNRIVRDFNRNQPLPISINTHSDAVPGSGLGSSSTMVVSILSAFRELLKLPLGEYDLAYLAYQIERVDCQLSGGKQDQYAATFGGFNFMEFYKDDRVLVNPLRIRRAIENELQSQLLLYFTGISRDSGKIIEDQIKASNDSSETGKESLAALHQVKEIAYSMKEYLLKSDINSMADVLADSWQAKKSTSKSISNPHIEEIAELALTNGAKSLKLSGAGGGGFMIMFVEPTKKLHLSNLLAKQDGIVSNFQFTSTGEESWIV